MIHFSPVFQPSASHPPPPGGGQVFGDGTKTPLARSAPLLTPPNQSDPLRHPSPAIWSSFEPLPRGVFGGSVFTTRASTDVIIAAAPTLGVADLEGD